MAEIHGKPPWNWSNRETVCENFPSHSMSYSSLQHLLAQGRVPKNSLKALCLNDKCDSDLQMLAWKLKT